MVFHCDITLSNSIPMARTVYGDNKEFVIINYSETIMESCCGKFLD